MSNDTEEVQLSSWARLQTLNGGLQGTYEPPQKSAASEEQEVPAWLRIRNFTLEGHS